MIPIGTTMLGRAIAKLVIWTLVFIGVGFGTGNWWLALAAFAAVQSLSPYAPT